ncbi:HK97-gp10 family putative phage morphogenesis protein [Actinobacillus pleuropneumoniae]|uniref:HK97-gp10 family putative phage morphogenesis protein n=1 Tax=Actinobacillus pleuropneumoniae TaxID=715 RepID=UPI003B02CB5D
MSVKITGLKEIQANMKKIEKQLQKENGKAIRKSLNAGAKELKSAVKPYIPVLGSSTNFRQKGTVKNNLRHNTKIAKDGMSGKTIVRIRRAGKKRMARIGENTRDRTDPFYWYLLDQGTSKMKGQHFLQKGESAGRARALNTVRNKFYEEMKNVIK